jgi:hypothetical protein
MAAQLESVADLIAILVAPAHPFPHLPGRTAHVEAAIFVEAANISGGYVQALTVNIY